jgi:drug/metabolite transporter (DMT)-like permease
MAQAEFAYGQLPLPPDDDTVLAPDAPVKASRCLTACGYLLILIMVFSNVLSGEVTQRMEDHGFDQPILIVYINHSAGIVCLPFAALQLWWNSTSLEEALSAAGMQPTRWGLAWTCFLLSFIYKFNCMWTLALPLTSVSVFSAISQSSCVFVFGFSAGLRGEKPTAGTGAAVLVAMVGVLLVAVFGAPPGGTREDSLLGVLYSVLFTLGLGLYSVLYKKWTCRNPGSHLAVMLAVIGLMGVSTLLFFWPAVVAAGAAGVETNALPADPQVKYLLIICVIVAVLNNVLLMCALCLTSPLVVSVGSLLVMPVSSAIDWLVHGYAVRWQTALGCVLVATGFVLLTAVQLWGVRDAER